MNTKWLALVGILDLIHFLLYLYRKVNLKLYKVQDLFECGLDDGVFVLAAVTEALNAPSQYPGSSGTRNLHDNLSDLQAQVAASQKVLITLFTILTTFYLHVYTDNMTEIL